MSDRQNELSVVEPIQLFLCEINHLILHEDQPYIFRAAPGCQACADYLIPKPAQLNPRDWLLQGGGGFEGGEDGLRAVTFTGEGAIDLLEAYREYLRDVDRRTLTLEQWTPRQNKIWEYRPSQ